MFLPRSAREFANVIGVPLTLRLVEVAKDWRIYIPIRPMHANHPIVIAVGLDAAVKLQKAFGGSMMPLAGTKAVKAHARNVTIAEAWLRDGASITRLAKDHGVSCRTVDRALAKVSTSDVSPKPIAPNQ